MTNNLFDPELAMLPILTATWDQSPVGAVIVYQNPILQTEIGHWTGRPLVELIGAIANSDGQPEIEQLVREGSLVLSGSLNDLEVKYHSRKGEQHIQVAISDNTEINRLRDKIQRDDLVNSFLSVSSHELKTPLTVVQGMISMLEDYTVDEEQKQLLEMAYENTVKLDNIMSRMLSLFHDESFKQETQKEKPCININQFILKLVTSQ
jgi:signal transduction histidine kinase